MQVIRRRGHNLTWQGRTKGSTVPKTNHNLPSDIKPSKIVESRKDAYVKTHDSRHYNDNVCFDISGLRGKGCQFNAG